jgi:hypothetical protein
MALGGHEEDQKKAISGKGKRAAEDEENSRGAAGDDVYQATANKRLENVSLPSTLFIDRKMNTISRAEQLETVMGKDIATWSMENLYLPRMRCPLRTKAQTL